MRYILIVFAALFTIGCGESIKGNGNVVEVGREVPNFQDLETNGAIDVEINPGDNYTVRVVSDENLVGHIQTEVKGELLTVQYEPGLNINSTTAKVIVTAPFLNNVKASGSGDIKSVGTLKNNKMIVITASGSGNVDMAVDAPAIRVKISGSGDFNLRGDTRDAEYSIAGSGDIEARDLRTENLQIKIAGSGNAAVYASKSLRASVAGSGNVRYWGNPSLDGVNVAGSGNIKAGN